MSFSNLGKGIKRDLRVDKIIEANAHTAGSLYELEERLARVEQRTWVTDEQLSTTRVDLEDLVRGQLESQTRRIQLTEQLCADQQESISAVARHSSAVKASIPVIPEIPDVKPLQSGFKTLGNSIEDGRRQLQEATARIERLENSTTKRWLIASLVLHAGWVVWLVITNV